jgi:predicted secreted protein
MAFVHGRLAEVTVNSVTLTTFCDDLTITIDVDTAEVTTFGDSWKEFLAGTAGASFDIGGSWDPTTTTGPASAIGAIITAGAAVTFNLEPGGAAVNQARTGSCICTSYEETSSVDDKVAFSASFQVTGAVGFES